MTRFLVCALMFVPLLARGENFYLRDDNGNIMGGSTPLAMTCINCGGGTALPGGTAGQIQVNGGGGLAGVTLGGDATLNVGTGIVTVSRIGGVSISLGGALTLTGGAVTLTASGPTNLTLPSNGTLATMANVASEAATARANEASALPLSGGTTTGPVIDGSRLKITLTGAPYTVPPSTTWLSFEQSGTLPSQTLTLPSVSDGQRLLFNTFGAITALTFVPAVVGWSNGTSLPGGTAAEIYYDNAAAAWGRVR